MRARVVVAAIAIVACREKAAAPSADAGPMLVGEITQYYAFEVDDLCLFMPLGKTKEKTAPLPKDDPVGYLTAQAGRAEEMRTRTLIAALLAAPKSNRGAMLRGTFLEEAKPRLGIYLGDPGAPTAPWGYREPELRTWECGLADRLDQLK
jgi:hypothetical protein